MNELEVESVKVVEDFTWFYIYTRLYATDFDIRTGRKKDTFDATELWVHEFTEITLADWLGNKGFGRFPSLLSCDGGTDTVGHIMATIVTYSFNERGVILTGEEYCKEFYPKLHDQKVYIPPKPYRG